MDLFEYQGKQFLAQYGIAMVPGGIADTAEKSVAQADIFGYPVVVKAQVHVGGRGKAGGIKLAANSEEAYDLSKAIIGMDIQGHRVRTVWIERPSDIAKEYYASYTLDRATKTYLLMLSSKGGVEIEDVAKSDPDAIVRRYIDPVSGVTTEILEDVVALAGIDKKAQEGVIDILQKLYVAFVEGDADLVEINPLILNSDGFVRALDAKVTLDDNAAFRHPEWAPYAETVEYDGRERLAKERGLNYIGLSGTVGIIANGAGLAMSTLDVVNQVGGSAANFLDLGGGAGADTMAAALEVINTDENVLVVLVNIFGGIVRCDEVAIGIREALSRVALRSPIVIRLDGTNAEAAHRILQPMVSDKLMVEATMISAARRAVEIANTRSLGS